MLPITLALGFFICAVSAVPTISVKGAKLFAGGQQFFIKGVAYQGTPQDPLIDVAQCTVDAELMQTIGTNSIRVYHVNPYADHSGCMAVFESRGIYVWLDLDTFNTTIVQTAPTWTQTQFLAFTQVMDAFQGFTNLGGFWIGNEVINTELGSSAAPYIKAAVSDMKAYLAAKKYRPIPIGYSAADIASLRPALQNYLSCSSTSGQNIDFYGLNSYEWCGQSTYETSGYANLQNMSQGYNVPIFFSETGCNVARPRTFDDQGAIFGPNMLDTWSGSIIYEWVQETNGYGLVTYSNGGVTGVPTPIQPDFQNLASQWKNLSPTGVAEAAYTPTYGPPACPKMTAGIWVVDGNVAVPTMAAGMVEAIASSRPAIAAATTPSTATTTYVLTAAEIAPTPSPTLSTDSASGTTQSTSTSSSSSTAKPNKGDRLGVCRMYIFVLWIGVVKWLL